jgi:hypothetical protein
MMADPQVVERLSVAVAELTQRHGAPDANLDTQVPAKWRHWLGKDLPWAGPGITDDEFFFLSTLCGTMTLDGQRTHMRRFFPSFVTEVGRDIRRFTKAVLDPWRLRSPWMKTRLVRMAEVLAQRDQDMAAYTNNLRRLEASATPTDPMPAFDTLVRDHRGGGQKTLSIFIRDCVLGNSFPIDSRVSNILNRYELPSDERCLVSAALSLGLNPRNVERLFYDAGGDGTFFTQGS